MSDVAYLCKLCGVRSATEGGCGCSRLKILEEAITELRQMHGALHPECYYKGPTTCPTWAAVIGLERLLQVTKDEA